MMMQPDSIKTAIVDGAESIPYGSSLSLGWVLVKMVFFLGLLLVLIFALAYVYRRWMRVGIHGGNADVRELQQVVIGAGKSVSFIKLFDEIVAIYHAGQTATEIGRWPADQMMERIKNLDTANQHLFKQLLKQKMK